MQLLIPKLQNLMILLQLVPSTTEAHALHASKQQKTTISVFLATAQVVVITPNRETTTRALIDQGSKIFLISERLA